jgi:segregation and condensation protein A
VPEPEFEEDVGVDRGESEPAFRVDLDGFEGPLDLLLELARRQKVDLHRISVLALAEQYLAFIEEARRVRLELAADYLVMAAWLAYLKSRLLIPAAPKSDEPEAADLAAELAARLRRLELFRKAADELANRPRLGRDFVARGAPESVTVARVSRYDASLYDLLTAYARQRQQHALSKVTVKQRLVWSLAEARATLERLVGSIGDWSALDAFLGDFCASPEERRTARASTFSASLEMVREGRIELRQDLAFGPLWLRPRAPKSEAA